MAVASRFAHMHGRRRDQMPRRNTSRIRMIDSSNYRIKKKERRKRRSELSNFGHVCLGRRSASICFFFVFSFLLSSSIFQDVIKKLWSGVLGSVFMGRLRRWWADSAAAVGLSVSFISMLAHGVHATAKQVSWLFFLLFILFLGWPALCSLCHAKPVLFTDVVFWRVHFCVDRKLLLWRKHTQRDELSHTSP